MSYFYDTCSTLNHYKEIFDEPFYLSAVTLQVSTFHSQMFGVTKPKDAFQRCVMDSLRNNQVAFWRVARSSGKSMSALAYLFEQLERGNLDRIVIFCNPVGAKNCAKLGFYPGSVLEKVLSTQAGHVLASKLGSEMEVERLISENKLEIIPAVDARGYEVPPHCGCYILEAQNLTSDTLRLLLQRTNADTKVIVDGDRWSSLIWETYSEDNGMKKCLKFLEELQFMVKLICKAFTVLRLRKSQEELNIKVWVG